MPSIPVSSALGYLGVASLLLSIFLILTGLDILRIERVSVTPGAKTLGFGIFLALLGIVFLWLDKADTSSVSPAPPSTVAIVPTHTPSPTPTLAETSTLVPPSATPTPTVPTVTVSVVREPTETPTPTFTPTETPMPTFTPTETPMPALTPTETLMPTLAPTEAPMPTSTPFSCPPLPAVSTSFKDVWDSVQGIGCAAQDALTGTMGQEDFEYGRMFWSEHANQFWPIDASDIDPILVLFNDKTWQLIKHPPWKGPSEFTCSAPNDDQNNPSCPPTPKRGFGKVWCEVPEIGGRLGNVVKCERGYQGTMQRFDQGLMLESDSGDIHVLYYDKGNDRLDYGHWERK